MNVRRLGRRKVDLSDPAMQALQIIAHLDHLTPQEALDRLVLDFLELRWDEVSAIEETLPARPPRPPAKVIDMGRRRGRRGLEQAGEIRDVMERSQALRVHSSRLRERARLMRATARQCIHDADLAWHRYA